MAGQVEDNPAAKEKLIRTLRKSVKDYICKLDHRSALFWAERAVTVSKGHVHDLYWLSHCLFLTGQFHRAIHFLEKENAFKNHILCGYLYAKCQVQLKNWKEAIDIIDHFLNESGSLKKQKLQFLSGEPESEQTSAHSGLLLVRGQIFETLELRDRAAESYQVALRLDVTCYEALDALLSHNLLNAEEESQCMALLSSQLAASGLSSEETSFLHIIYTVKLKKYKNEEEVRKKCASVALADDPEILSSVAENHYNQRQLTASMKLIQKVLAIDPYHPRTILVYLALLVEMKEKNDLFKLAHQLIDHYPREALSWYAVACYYYLINRGETARQYYSRATVLDRNFCAAWLAHAHSFSMEKEHDQAISIYLKLSQMTRGGHLPFLYVGLEYERSNNHSLAEKYFHRALKMVPEDPATLHEIGTVALYRRNYDRAVNFFIRALNQLDKHSLSPSWEPLVNNLAHAYRKLGKFDEAVEYHLLALKLNPKDASTFLSLALTSAYKDDYEAALRYCHHALAVDKDSSLANSMIQKLIQEYVLSTMLPYEPTMPEHKPKFIQNAARRKLEDEIQPKTPTLSEELSPASYKGDETPKLSDSDMQIEDLSMDSVGE